MTLEEIELLTVEDCQPALEYRLIAKDSEVIISPELLQSELLLYKASLTQMEQDRLDAIEAAQIEQARIDDLQSRLDSLKDAQGTHSSYRPDVPNMALFIKQFILENPDKVEAESKMVEFENADTAKFDAYQLVKYKDQRKAEYPSISDQLDMIFHDQEDGTTTFKDAIKAIKLKYPKA